LLLLLLLLLLLAVMFTVSESSRSVVSSPVPSSQQPAGALGLPRGAGGAGAVVPRLVARRARPLEVEEDLPPLDLPGTELIDKIVKGADVAKDETGAPMGATDLADLAQGTKNPVPQLPEWIEPIAQVFLAIFPVVVLGSWVYMTWISRDMAMEAKEADDKRKIRKAIKIDDKELTELEAMDNPAQMPKRKKRQSPLMEALELEQGGRRRKRSSRLSN